MKVWNNYHKKQNSLDTAQKELATFAIELWVFLKLSNKDNETRRHPICSIRELTYTELGLYRIELFT